MTHTVGRLWRRYTEVRRRLADTSTGIQPSRLADLEREARQLRDRLLVNYSPLVKYVAGRVGARMTGVVDHEDFMSWGILGLLSAIETYDAGHGTKFETYAISKIRWAILDEFRKEDRVPRRLRAQIQEFERTKGRLTQELHRAPTEAEIAREAGVSVERHRSILEQYSRASVVSIEARVESEDGAGADLAGIVVDRTAADPQSEAERGEVRERLIAAFETLREQERLVATFYFYEGLTLKEIGQAMSLTEGRISQILRKALEKLRHVLIEHPAFRSGI